MNDILASHVLIFAPIHEVAIRIHKGDLSVLIFLHLCASNSSSWLSIYRLCEHSARFHALLPSLGLFIALIGLHSQNVNICSPFIHIRLSPRLDTFTDYKYIHLFHPHSLSFALFMQAKEASSIKLQYINPQDFPSLLLLLTTFHIQHQDLHRLPPPSIIIIFQPHLI